jgi:hypothetical protein
MSNLPPSPAIGEIRDAVFLETRRYQNESKDESIKKRNEMKQQRKDGTHFDFIYYFFFGSVGISGVYNANYVGFISL